MLRYRSKGRRTPEEGLSAVACKEQRRHQLGSCPVTTSSCRPRRPRSMASSSPLTPDLPHILLQGWERRSFGAPMVVKSRSTLQAC